MTILFVNTSPHHNAHAVVMNQKLLRVSKLKKKVLL